MRSLLAALAVGSLFAMGQVMAQAPAGNAPAAGRQGGAGAPGAAPAAGRQGGPGAPGAAGAQGGRGGGGGDYAQRMRLFGTDLAPVEPFRVIGNIYYVGSVNQGIYLITSPQGHILLDVGPSLLQGSIWPNIMKLGFNIADVKVLLITHAHVDHVQGLGYAQRASGGAPIMVMEADVKAIESGKDLSSIGIEGWEPVTVARVLHDNDEVHLGGIAMRAIWAPGHTPGNTTWITTVQDGGKNYTVAFGGAPGPVIGNPKFETNEQDALTSFRRLKETQVDLILPGHPRQAFEGKIDAMRAGTRPHPLLLEAGAWTKQITDAENNYKQRLATLKATPPPAQ